MTTPAHVTAIVPAAGAGTRLPGAVRKPFLPLGDEPILARTVGALSACDRVTAVIVAVAEADIEHTRALLDRAGRTKVTAVVPGGATRRASVAAGLAAAAAADWVLVHDGVRPFVSPDLVARVLEAARAIGAATAALPVTDTLKAVDDGRVRRTVDRRGLYAVQTPQAFRAELLREAHRRVPAEAAVTDDAELVERMGGTVAVVAGDPANIKITTPEEYALTRARLEAVAGPARVGVGYDVHRLVPGRALVLGGVHVPSPRGLLGHSDADALTHAIMDALLGAAGLPDIGHLFPPDDPAYREADSVALLGTVAVRLRAAGWAVLNVDAIVCAEAPRLAPFVAVMRARLADALAVPVEAIGVKATTAEGLGAVGRGDGISAQAVALLRRAG
jgi:2-C-methyl-D-erythritol 4-phosphate cytidylyltransferase/2-C-methyl-D-erythritol 2,4-cyclodiphosphate synthase